MKAWPCYPSSAYVNFALLGRLKPGDEAEHGGLATATGSEKSEKAPRLNIQPNPAHRRHRPKTLDEIAATDSDGC